MAKVLNYFMALEPSSEEVCIGYVGSILIIMCDVMKWSFDERPSTDHGNVSPVVEWWSAGPHWWWHDNDGMVDREAECVKCQQTESQRGKAILLMLTQKIMWSFAPCSVAGPLAGCLILHFICWLTTKVIKFGHGWIVVKWMAAGIQMKTFHLKCIFAI